MNISTNSRFRRTSLAVIAAGLLIATPAFSNEDEWYDPTDWFDGDNVERSDNNDSYNDYLRDPDYDRDWNEHDAWGVDVWGMGFYDPIYWDRYGWSGQTNETARTVADDSRSNTEKSKGSERQVSSSSAPSKADDAFVHTLIVFGDGKKKEPMARLSGTIEGIEQMQLERDSGGSGLHTLARIKLENGNGSVVSLGRSSNLKGVDLQKGKKIEAIGRRGEIDGQSIFVANRIRIDGRDLEAHPAVRLNPGRTTESNKSTARTSQQASGASRGKLEQTETFRGEVAKVNRLSTGAHHTLVQLRLADGSACTVDFGPAASLERIGLNEGDRVIVRGQTVKIDGRNVVKPALLQINGERVESVTNS